ncbi:MAG TPA: DUF4191 domain-containing protein [Jiangellaceae bacterium]
MARNKQDDGAPKKKGRIAQIKQTYRMAKRSDPRIGWLSLGLILLVLAAFIGLGFLIGPLWTWAIIALPSALLAGAILFGRRAERAAYAQIEGEPGAATAALGTLRRGWDTTTAVAINKQQDVVHRAVGKAGIVLVGEGSSHARLTNLLAQERRRHERISPETPVHEIIVGRGEGQVPLPKLAKHVGKLPKKLRGAELTELRSRLRALRTSSVPMPKGPLPKGMKLPQGQMPQQQR